MSESHPRRKSDFSIARILSDDSNISNVKSTESCISSVSTYLSHQDDDDADTVDVVTVEHESRADKFNLHNADLSPEDKKTNSSPQSELQWLQCTRYRPPRLPRRTCGTRNGKRRPATHPRIPFTTFQLEVLEDKYKSGPYLTRKDVVQLSGILRLPQSRVKIWFQNRRARDRRESKVSSSLTIS